MASRRGPVTSSGRGGPSKCIGICPCPGFCADSPPNHIRQQSSLWPPAFPGSPGFSPMLSIEDNQMDEEAEAACLLHEHDNSSLGKSQGAIPLFLSAD